MSTPRLCTLFTLVALAACGSTAKEPTTASPPAPAGAPTTAAAPTTTTAPTTAAPPAAASPPPGVNAAEFAAYERAKPAFGKFCSRCHSEGTRLSNWEAMRQFNMMTYPFGSQDAPKLGKSIRTSLGIGGGKATMPKGHAGEVQGEDLALIAAWADAYDAAH